MYHKLRAYECIPRHDNIMVNILIFHVEDLGFQFPIGEVLFFLFFSFPSVVIIIYLAKMFCIRKNYLSANYNHKIIGVINTEKKFASSI